MKKIRVLELFGGIRAPYKALLNLGIKVETADYVENDPKVVKIANAIYETNYLPVSAIDYHYQGTEEIDLIVGGSPCQDISSAGKQAGAEEDTRSSLIWEQLRIVMEVRPRFYLWENVKNLLSARHSHIFQEHNNFLESIGYRIEYKVLNAKDFGIPQNRERVFILAIRNDIESNFNFWNLKTKIMQPLRDFLETNILNEKYFIPVNSYVETHFKTNQPRGEYWGITKILDKDKLQATNTITTNQRRNMNSGLVLEKTPENSWITLSDGSRRETFKPSPINKIVTLPISKNLMSCKVATDGAIPILTTKATNKILDNRYYLKKPKDFPTEYATQVEGIKSYEKSFYKNWEVYMERTNYLQFPNFKGHWDFGAYSRVWHKDIVGTIPVANVQKILEPYKTKSGILKASLYSVNSENYLYEKESQKPINTIPSTGRTAKILEPTETKTGHLIVPMSKYQNANNVHSLNNHVPLRTIATNTRRNGSTERLLNELVDRELLVVKYQDKLWNVRVLTELECYRLMGFDDEDFYKAQKVETSRMLYHTAGNSIVVNVLEAIFSELFKV